MAAAQPDPAKVVPFLDRELKLGKDMGRKARESESESERRWEGRGDGIGGRRYEEVKKHFGW